MVFGEVFLIAGSPYTKNIPSNTMITKATPITKPLPVLSVLGGVLITVVIIYVD